MKFIDNFYLSIIIFLLPFSAAFAAHREGPEPKEVEARQELETKTKEAAKKEIEIEQRKKEIDKEVEDRKISEEKANQEKIKLDGEMETSLDAKRQALDDLLSFKPDDTATLEKQKKALQEKISSIETQIKALEQRLASEGTSTVPDKGQPKKSYIEILFGKEFNTNLQIWTKTKLADFYLYIGEPLKAKKMYLSLAEIYKGLNQPVEFKENYLKAELTDFAHFRRDSFLIKNALEDLLQYQSDLEDIINGKNKALRSAVTEQDRKKAVTDAEYKIKAALRPEIVEETVVKLNELKAKLDDPLLKKMLGKTDKNFLDSITRDITKQFSQINTDINITIKGIAPAEMENNAKKTYEYLFTEGVQSILRKDLTEALTGGQHMLAIREALGEKYETYEGYKTPVIDEQFASLVGTINSLKSLDYSLLDLEKAKKVTKKLRDIYTEIDQRYEKLTYPDLLKNRIGSKEKVQKWKEFYQKEYENTLFLEMENQDKSLLERDSQYKALNEQNKKAKVIAPDTLEKAETDIGLDKKTFEGILDSIQTSGVPKQIDVLANQLGKKIETMLFEISKADPSERSVISLKIMADTLTNMRNQIDAAFMTTDLSPEAQIALAKIYLQAQVRGEQISTQLAHDQSSLAVIIGDKVVYLPAVERANVTKLQTVSTRSTQATIEAAKDLWNAKKPDPTEIAKQNALIKEIDNVSSVKTELSNKTQGQSLVDAYLKSKSPAPKIINTPQKTTSAGSSEPDPWSI